MAENSTMYDWTNPKATLEIIKGNILSVMKIEEEWYIKYRKRHSFSSRTIRVVVIILFSLGIMWPILEASLNWPGIKDWNLGYVSLAVGGLLLLLDKYLGVSSGYVRFYIAELDIKKNTMEFLENWSIETAKSSNPLSLENILTLLNLVKTFRQAVFMTIQVETGAWATEFQTQTGELFELYKQKQKEFDDNKANLSVVIENFNEYSEIEIGIDNELPIPLNGMTSTVYRNTSIGPHTIVIKAVDKNGKAISFSKNIDAVAGKTVELVLNLP
jgi:hypothetical protein